MLTSTDLDSLINESQNFEAEKEKIVKDSEKVLSKSKKELLDKIETLEQSISKLKASVVHMDDLSELFGRNLENQQQYFQSKQNEVKNAVLRFIDSKKK